jgi:hypothetical protein
MAMANIIGEHKAKSKEEKASVDVRCTWFETAARKWVRPEPATFVNRRGPMSARQY